MSESTPAIDKLDRAILRRLQDNGRETYDVIGEQVGLSPSAVLRRAKRLEECGVIDRYVALVRPEAVGLGLTAYIMDTLLKHPSVQDCKTSFVLDRVKATTAVPV
jgi:Lrp/AsnC family leucine-responsive transcriptional regulator